MKSRSILLKAKNYYITKKAAAINTLETISHKQIDELLKKSKSE